MISNLLTLSLVALLPALAAADCTTFTPDTQDGQAVYTTPGRTIAISDGQTCAGPKECWYGSPPTVNVSSYNIYDIMVGGLITDNRTISISGSQDTLNSLYTLITKATNLAFIPSVTTNETDGFGFGVQANSSGYVGFTPTHNCVKGTVSGCSSQEFPNDGTVLEACSPKTVQNNDKCTTPGGYDCVAGTVSWVATDRETANETHCTPCALERQASAGAVKGTDIALVMAVAGAVVAFMV